MLLSPEIAFRSNPTITDTTTDTKALKLLKTKSLAERVGFEPTLEFPLNTLSKRAPSATRPSLRRRIGGRNDFKASELAASCRAKSAAIRRQFNFMGETIEPQLARQIRDVLF
jgi:hypothetical protein